MKPRLFFLLPVLAILLSLPACQPDAKVRMHSDAVGSSRKAPLETNLNRTPEQLEAEVDEHLAEARRLIDRVVALEGRRTVDNTVNVINEAYMHLDKASEMSSLFAQVHPQKAVRDVADVASQEVSRFITELQLDRDLFEAFKAVDVSDADAETQRLMFITMRDFRRAGVDRDERTRDKIKRLQEQIVKLSQDFSNNIREDVRHVELDSRAELAGLPEDYVNAHPPNDDGKIVITTDYPDYIPFIKYASDPQARLAIYRQYRSRGYPHNIDVLDELLAKRYQLATLLGYENFAEYITEDKMIKTDEAVNAFINRVAKLAQGPAAADMALLLQAKRRRYPDATEVADHEKDYYEELVKAEKFNFSSQEARPYFEFNRVRQGLFDVTARLFDIEYRPVKGIELWHPDVTAWDVYDDGEHIGRFMLDLHPREGKYKHAACFGYQTGVLGRRIPINVLVCNFPNPKSSTGPALMEHDDVVTFFHEFGHLLHAIFAGHHKYIGISGIATEWDFVEAPSQMLEEWCWDTDTLQMFARHHQTDQPIPAGMVQRMRATRDFGKGMWVRQQMFYAAISLNFHNRDPQTFDTTDMLRQLTDRYAPCDYVEDTYMHCSFGHLTGYSAIYYTYMWSMVIAKDMFSRFDDEGLFDRAVADRYRRFILQPGGSKEAAELVRDFLGRPYDFQAYGEWLASKATPMS